MKNQHVGPWIRQQGFKHFDEFKRAILKPENKPYEHWYWNHRDPEQFFRRALELGNTACITGEEHLAAGRFAPCECGGACGRILEATSEFHSFHNGLDVEKLTTLIHDGIANETLPSDQHSILISGDSQIGKSTFVKPLPSLLGERLAVSARRFHSGPYSNRSFHADHTNEVALSIQIARTTLIRSR